MAPKAQSSNPLRGILSLQQRIDPMSGDKLTPLLPTLEDMKYQSRHACVAFNLPDFKGEFSWSDLPLKKYDSERDSRERFSRVVDVLTNIPHSDLPTDGCLLLANEITHGRARELRSPFGPAVPSTVFSNGFPNLYYGTWAPTINISSSPAISTKF